MHNNRDEKYIVVEMFSLCFPFFSFLNLSQPAFHHSLEVWLQPVCFSILFFYSSLAYNNINLSSKITPDVGHCKKLTLSTGRKVWFCSFFPLPSIVFPVFSLASLWWCFFPRWSDIWCWIFLFHFFLKCVLQPTECFLSQPEETPESTLKAKKRKKVWMPWYVYLGTGQWVCLLLWDSKVGHPCCCVKLHSVAAFVLEKNNNSHSYDFTQIIHSLHELNCRVVPKLLSRVVRYLYLACRCGTPEKWDYQRKMANQNLPWLSSVNRLWHPLHQELSLFPLLLA